ncbi:MULTISPECIES: glycosyltransferase family 4 protein [Bacteroides]|uniref:Glycosyltransferase family 4 protein n=1 Tax=Bacteroides zhangwenhongii TaxID=2650157 RepID=A0ABT5HAC8_9BACE|nr:MULTISPECIES: glycosyltransferase family 4 protein [Bacteroides]MDC7137532.1 glycosyltransferase family 4 protein [Bacteroides zhangwenhongii]OKZ21780.1 MAG: lipopolysaccharide N-acetylglucosaminyltransferase [Bacteroides finegoldii]
MKILLVHNNYGKYSGEEAVVDKMASMFREHGHEVCFYRLTTERSRESLSGKIKGFLCGIYSPSGVKGLREILEREKPDVVNVHNLYPFISPAALFECKKTKVPVVMTVHNFRLICPTGLFMRNGKPCEVCLQKRNEWGCIQYNCEHSYFKSVGYTLRNVYARWTGAYKNNVRTFACITEFQRKKLIEAGFDKNKIVVIPNSIDIPLKYETTFGSYVAYIGRLSYEKGYDLLVEIARKYPEIQFCFAGAKREDTNIAFPKNVQLMGYLKGKELEHFIKNARLVVIPSRCYEGFPMAILEAAQFGKPCVCPDHGGFTEIIGKGENTIGRLFEPNNLNDLEKQILALWNQPVLVEELEQKAYEKLQKEYSSEVVYNKWNELFTKILYG